MPIVEGDAEQKLPVPEPLEGPLMWRCVCSAAIQGSDDQPLLDAVAEHVRFDCPKVQRAAPAPVWPPNADAMTLGQVEALAKRLATAAATFNEARALLGAPQPMPAPAVVPAAVQTVPPQPVVQLANGATSIPRPPSRIDPEAEQELIAFRMSQERQRLVQANRDDPSNFPPGIANAMRGQ